MRVVSRHCLQLFAEHGVQFGLAGRARIGGAIRVGCRSHAHVTKKPIQESPTIYLDFLQAGVDHVVSLVVILLCEGPRSAGLPT